jgi:hypothetical protein
MSKKWTMPDDYTEKFVNKIKECDKMFGIDSFKKKSSDNNKGCLVVIILIVALSVLISSIIIL